MQPKFKRGQRVEIHPHGDEGIINYVRYCSSGIRGFGRAGYKYDIVIQKRLTSTAIEELLTLVCSNEEKGIDILESWDYYGA